MPRPSRRRLLLCLLAPALIGAAEIASAGMPMLPITPVIATVPVTSDANASAAAILAIKPVVDDDDLWQRVRRGFRMAEMTSTLVSDQERWYASRPDYIERFVERGSKYLYHVIEEVERRGLPTEIVLLPIIESAYNPQAYSRAHAAGMWQFIPSTGKNYGLKQDWLADQRRDIVLSTNAALDYLSMLYGMFNSWELAFAAYNCGEGCVGRAIAANLRRGKPTDFASLNLPKETRSYVPKLMAVRNIISAPGGYGISLASVRNRPYFTSVVAPEKIDVSLAARLAEMDEAEFAALNPAFTRPVAESGTGTFLVPTGKAETFRINLDLYRSLNGPMVSWQTAIAKRGEAVDAVAKRHGMTASYLRATSGPFKERKGRFTQPASFLMPISNAVQAIRVALEKKVELRNAPPLAAVADGDDRPLPLANQRGLDAAPPRTQTPTVVSTPTVVATTHRVVSGDTLSAIADRYRLSVDQLRALNKLRGNHLAVGQTVRLGSAAATAATQTSYIIRAGDNLFAIARKFSVPIESLMAWNKLGNHTIIQPGDKLRIALQ